MLIYCKFISVAYKYNVRLDWLYMVMPKRYTFRSVYVMKNVQINGCFRHAKLMLSKVVKATDTNVCCCCGLFTARFSFFSCFHFLLSILGLPLYLINKLCKNCGLKNVFKNFSDRLREKMQGTFFDECQTMNWHPDLFFVNL